MRKPVKFLIVFVVSIPVLVALYFFENIQGYYKFKQYCAKEGGLKVYEKLEKGATWMAEDKSGAETISTFDHVGSSVYLNDKLYIQVNFLGGNRTKNDSYSYSEFSDIGIDKISYIWRRNFEFVQEENRLKKISYFIMKPNSNRVVVSHSSFSYSIFDQSKAFLGSPSSISCYDSGVFIKNVNKFF